MGPFDYFGNSVSTKDEIEDAIYEAISELELRLQIKPSNEEYKAIAEAYFENYDVEELKATGFLSYMHPQSYAILCCYELKAARVSVEKAFKDGSAF